MKVPVLDGGAMGGTSAPAALGEEILAACAAWGCFYLAGPPRGTSFPQRALDAARAFFALPEAEKQALAMAHSPHYRGYSAMKGMSDDREQMHLGAEYAAVSEGAPAFRRLEGPNLWPARLGRGWRQAMLTYHAAADRIGRAIMENIARALRLPPSAFAPRGFDRPYLLMKLLHYRPDAGQRGEAMGAHCDWSFVTILAQDGPGLEARTPSGRWVSVPSIDGTVLVTVGELTEIVTGGALVATPHRVAGVCGAGRLSVPVFVNPDLRQAVRAKRPVRAQWRVASGEHVHRVRQPGRPVAPFLFGESEWARKGKGRWCYRTACLGGAERALKGLP